MNAQRCRICLEAGEKMTPFFSKTKVQDEETSINEMFARILSTTEFLDVSENSEEYVCEHCLLSLKQAYVFKILCHLSQEYRRRYAKPLCRSNSYQVGDGMGNSKPNKRLKKSHSCSTRMRLRSSNGNLCNMCCNKVTKQKSLILEKRTNKNNKLFNCNVCTRSFKTASILTHHINQHHKQCKKCKRFINQDKPVAIQSGVKHICSTCGQGFLSASLLNMHSRTHVDKKNHTCSICGKSYVRPIHLELHMRNHTGYKLHLCSLCKAAYHPNKLHKCKSTGDLKNLCTICNKSFVSKNALVRHYRLHSGAIRIE